MFVLEDEAFKRLSEMIHSFQQIVSIILILGILIRKTSENKAVDRWNSNNSYDNNKNNNNTRLSNSSRNSDLISFYNEVDDNYLKNLINYTMFSVQNPNNIGLQEEAKKHSIILTHRNQHWIEQVTRKRKSEYYIKLHSSSNKFFLVT